MPLPTSIDEVTPCWLTSALSRRHPGTEVTTLSIVDVIQTTATKLRLRMSYNAAGEACGLPPTMVLKGGLGNVGHEAGFAHLYRNEAVFYRDVAPTLDIPLARCFYADSDAATGVIVLEDLVAAGAHFGAGSRPLSAETAAAALEYQARLHARWWQDAALGQFPLTDFDEFMRWFSRQTWQRYEISGDPRERPLLDQARWALSDIPGFKQAVMTLHEFNQTSPQCLIHVDAHVGNMYFDAAGRPAWLDWQASCRGAWAWDVAYFLISALTVADRRAHERDLLRHYLECLCRHGVTSPPAWDEAWLAYRRNALWGLCWVLVPETLQSIRDINPIVERFAAAVVDLDTLPSLGLPKGRYDFRTD